MPADRSPGPDRSRGPIRTRPPNALHRLREQLVEGSDLTVAEHFRPDNVGNRYRLLTVQLETAKAAWLNHPPATPHFHVWITIPTAARDVEWLTNDTVRLTLRKLGPDLTVTYRLGVIR